MTLPELHLADWRATKDTLHLYTQIIGKIRLATAPPRNHWWNAALRLDVTGLTTGPLHHPDTTFEIKLDLLNDELNVRTADGRARSFSLAPGLAVADFDARLHDALRDLGVDVQIAEHPFGIPITTPFTDDVEHASWDSDAVHRFLRTLNWSESVFDEFSGWFSGKTSPVHFFWHSFDLAVTRFSGRRAEAMDADAVTREAYSHELISFGFWPGDERIDAAFYSYTAPEPAQLRDRPLPIGEWIESGSGSLAVLPYDHVRSRVDPRATLLTFLQSAYDIGAGLAGWDTASLQSTWAPTTRQLELMRRAADRGAS
jgi:hypothetical protein